MNKKTLISLLAFVVLGIGAVVALRAPEKGEVRGPHAAPQGVAPLTPEAIDELEVTTGKDKTTLKKDGDKWLVVAPVTYPADPQAVKAAVDNLGQLEWGAVVSEKKERAADLEVDDEKGTRVVVKHGGSVLADLVLGKNVSGSTMVRPTGSDQIWQAGGLTKWVLAKDTKSWRDRAITDLEREQIESIRVDTGRRGTITVRRIPPDKDKGQGEKWEVAESTAKIDKLDEEVPGGLASAAASLKAADFADGAKPEETGLDQPAFTVTIKAGAKTATVLVGKAKDSGGSVYVKTADSPQVFLIPKDVAERLSQAPADFGDKTLTNLAADDLVALAIEYGGSKVDLVKSGADWKSNGPALAVESSKVTPITQAFANWKASSFSDTTDPKVTGLGKPTARVTVRTKDQKQTTLLIGALQGDDYYVQVAGRSAVYRAKKPAVDRLLKKPEDLKKVSA